MSKSSRKFPVAVLVMLASTTVGAQTLEEIVVTATKRQESLQDVNLAYEDEITAPSTCNATDGSTPANEIAGIH